MPRPKLYTTTKATSAGSPSTAHVSRDDTQVAVQRLKYIWFVAALKTLFIPLAIFMIAATYDVVPWAPSAGAFVIGAGAITIMASFPIVNQYRTLFTEMDKAYGRFGKVEPGSFAKLNRLLFAGALFAEFPSALGLLHFMMTFEFISSMLLCVPAVMIMFVAYRPEELRLRPVVQGDPAEAE